LIYEPAALKPRRVAGTDGSPAKPDGDDLGARIGDGAGGVRDLQPWHGFEFQEPPSGGFLLCKLFANFTKEHFGKREFLAANSDHLIRCQWIRDCDRPRFGGGVNCSFANLSAPRWPYNEGQNEDSSSISRSCSFGVIGTCRTIAANGRAFPAAFAVQ
jgi:hypothetical protein